MQDSIGHDEQAAESKRPWKLRSSGFSLNAQFSIRSRWVRLVLLVLAVSGLSVAGAALGRGFGTVVVTTGETVAIAPTTAAPPVQTVPAVSAPIVAPMAVPTAATPATASAAPSDPSRPAAVEGGWPALAQEHFDAVTESWPEVRSPSWSSSYQDGGFVVQVDSRPGISYSRPLRSHDFWFGADVRITRGQAGLFFLIGRPNDFYRFLIDTEGHYQLEWQQVGASRPLIAWAASDALRRGAGAANQIAVRRSGEELAFYANGALLATYTLPSGNTLESRMGLALDAPESGRGGQAWFDNLVVRAPKP